MAARLHNESGGSMQLRLREITRLEDQIARNEQLWSDLTSRLMEMDTFEYTEESMDIIRKRGEVNVKIIRAQMELARLKAPSDLTDKDREFRKRETFVNERNNIKY